MAITPLLLSLATLLAACDRPSTPTASLTPTTTMLHSVTLTAVAHNPQTTSGGAPRTPKSTAIVLLDLRNPTLQTAQLTIERIEIQDQQRRSLPFTLPSPQVLTLQPLENQKSDIQLEISTPYTQPSVRAIVTYRDSQGVHQQTSAVVQVQRL